MNTYQIPAKKTKLIQSSELDAAFSKYNERKSQILTTYSDEFSSAINDYVTNFEKKLEEQLITFGASLPTIISTAIETYNSLKEQIKKYFEDSNRENFALLPIRSNTTNGKTSTDTQQLRQGRTIGTDLFTKEMNRAGYTVEELGPRMHPSDTHLKKYWLDGHYHLFVKI
jgi:hypothetical protein